MATKTRPRRRLPSSWPQGTSKNIRYSILQAIDDPAVFAPWFARGDWIAWRAFLAVLFGLSLTAEQQQIVTKHTGRDTFPREPFRGAWLIVGRRGGKSFMLALIAAYLAAFRDFRPYLQRGEVATIAIIAADRRQARTIRRYVEGFFTHIPMLKQLVLSMTNDGVVLNRQVVIEVHTCSFRTVRGYTLAAALCDEAAFWRDDTSANPDKEVIAALRPGLGNIPESMLLVASTPYAKRGIVWDAFRRCHGSEKQGSDLVWKATTLEMNPTFDASIITTALEDDESAARAEYLAEFRNDVESFVAAEAVDACVEPDVHERGFDSQHRYVAFVDPSGGTNDSMTLAIGHAESETVIVDVLREMRAPFSPEDVVSEFVETLYAYRVRSLQGCLLYTSPSPRDLSTSRMPSSA
nr:hypothetical protein 1 [bacterium]